MKYSKFITTFSRVPIAAALGLVLASAGIAQTSKPGGIQISAAVEGQIAQILNTKGTFNDAQKKMDSQLVFSALAASRDARVRNLRSANVVVNQVGGELIPVDIYGRKSNAVLSMIAKSGGTVTYVSKYFDIIHASIPLTSIERVAALSDVKEIRPMALAMTNSGRRMKAPTVRDMLLSNAGLDPLPSPFAAATAAARVGALTSQGYISHGANVAVSKGYIGSGQKVGVLSDSASATRVSALIASGDLPANTQVLAGQAGSGGDEGTAMMEIVYDMAPGSQPIFATAFNGVGSFADNIIALKNAGCKVIVDDITYFDEGAFQDGPIARAINTVTAAGVTYVSSAGNNGNVTNGTSGTWEGDFADGGAVSGVISSSGQTGRFHKFGSAVFNRVTAAGGAGIILKWSDPLGASTNDYDLFVLNSAGTTIKAFSASVQSGTQDPYEFAGNSSIPAANDQVIVVRFSGQARALRLDANRGRLQVATSGAVYGHNAAENAISAAATHWNSARTGTKPFTGAANPTENFSSDGTRKVFYSPTGVALTAGNFLFATNGGVSLQKPDATAADGTSGKTPGFNPFFGTSAAAPHIAGMAALVLQARPDYTPAQVKAALYSSTLDNMAVGIDRDAGRGIIMAWPSIQYALSH